MNTGTFHVCVGLALAQYKANTIPESYSCEFGHTVQSIVILPSVVYVCIFFTHMCVYISHLMFIYDSL